MEDWAKLGYANPASYLYAQREAARKQKQAQEQRAKDHLAKLARARQTAAGAAADSTVYHLPPDLDPENR